MELVDEAVGADDEASSLINAFQKRVDSLKLDFFRDLASVHLSEEKAALALLDRSAADALQHAHQETVLAQALSDERKEVAQALSDRNAADALQHAQEDTLSALALSDENTGLALALSDRNAADALKHAQEDILSAQALSDERRELALALSDHKAADALQHAQEDTLSALALSDENKELALALSDRNAACALQHVQEDTLSALALSDEKRELALALSDHNAADALQHVQEDTLSALALSRSDAMIALILSERKAADALQLAQQETVSALALSRSDAMFALILSERKAADALQLAQQETASALSLSSNAAAAQALSYQNRDQAMTLALDTAAAAQSLSNQNAADALACARADAFEALRISVHGSANAEDVLATRDHNEELARGCADAQALHALEVAHAEELNALSLSVAKSAREALALAETNARDALELCRSDVAEALLLSDKKTASALLFSQSEMRCALNSSRGDVELASELSKLMTSTALELSQELSQSDAAAKALALSNHAAAQALMKAHADKVVALTRSQANFAKARPPSFYGAQGLGLDLLGPPDASTDGEEEEGSAPSSPLHQVVRESKNALFAAADALAATRHDMKSLLHKMLPSDVASSLQRDAGKAGGVVRKFASSCVFFADVQGYTEMAAQLGIDELCAFLVRFFDILDACIAEFPALYKVETIGDCYMVVSGSGDKGVDVATDIGLFALRVVESIPSLANPLTGLPIQLRLGLHAGPCGAAILSKVMPHYTFFGDTVNTASRMESTGEPGRIHVSDAFAALLAAEQREQEGETRRGPGGLAVTPRGTVDVKSKGKMETFWLQRLGPPSPSLLALARAMSPPPSPSLAAMALSLSPRPMSPLSSPVLGVLGLSEAGRCAGLGSRPRTP